MLCTHTGLCRVCSLLLEAYSKAGRARAVGSHIYLAHARGATAIPPTRLIAYSATKGQGRIIPAKMLSIRYFAYYIIFGINTGSIMPPPWVRRTWGRIARIWVPKSSSTRAGRGLPKLGAPPSPLGWRRRLRPPSPPSLRAPRRRSSPFNQLQPDRDSVCGRTGAPFRACGRSAADTEWNR